MMASQQIKGRVDGKQWTTFCRSEETVTESLQRLQQEHTSMCERDSQLKTLHPNPDIALGILLQSHKLLSQLVEQSAITQLTEAATAQTTSPPKQAAKFAAAAKY